MNKNLIEKNEIFKLDIPYILNINMYSLKAFAMQYHYKLYDKRWWIRCRG